jgi:hypothetical protein
VRRGISRERVAAEIGDFSPALLQELHLLTRDGALNADARRKLKQIQHLLRLLAPALDDVFARHPEPVLVDCGAGKSALGFLLHERVLAPQGRGTLHAIEWRADFAAAAAARAERLGAARVVVHACAIAEAAAGLPERVHLVTALHACDTATDEALLLAIRAGADHVAVVPCCQAEVARQLAGARNDDAALGALFAHAWHRREFASHLTNVIRALALEAHGYQVTVTELTGWEHAVKNELILAKRVQRHDARAAAQLEALLARFAVAPLLVRELASRPLDQAPPPATR